MERSAIRGIHPRIPLRSMRATAEPSATLEATLLVHDQRRLHPAWWQVVSRHLGNRLEQLELVAGRFGGPERHRRFKRRTTGQAAGDLDHQDRGVFRQGEALA